MEQILEDGPLSPPPKKKLSKGQRKRSRRKVNKNQSLTDDTESFSSDEHERKSLLITVHGGRSDHSGDGRAVRGRGLEQTPRRQSLMGEYRGSPCDGSQNHLPYSPAPSFSNSPFQHMNARHVSSPSHIRDDPPFPRTPHDYANQHQLQRHQSLDHAYSPERGPGWRERNHDHDSSRRSSYDYHQQASPLLPPPSTLPPSRSYSSPTLPPPYHRRYSEPARHYGDPSYCDASPSAGRGHVTHDGEYLTSSRGFRVSDQRARQVGYGNYTSESNRRREDRYGGPHRF